MTVSDALSKVVSDNRVTASVIVFLGVLHAVSNAYLGLVAPHVWRQSDAYSQILGMMGAAGLAPLGTFEDGTIALFDVPVYQGIVAALAWLTQRDPLVVVRFVDAILWVACAGGMYRVAEHLSRGSGLMAILLTTVSPLFLHYYSVPLPDTLSLALSLIGMASFLDGKTTSPAICFGLAALIKSPIPFVILVALGTWLLVTRRLGPTWRRAVVVSAISLSAALAPALLRGVITPPGDGSAGTPGWGWYFGALALRFEGGFWITIARRVAQAFPSALAAGVIGVASMVAVVAFWRRTWPVLLCVAAGFLAGWMVFSNLYYIHDYYGLPAMALLFVGLAAPLTLLVTERKAWTTHAPWIRAAAIILALLGVVYGNQLGGAHQQATREVSALPSAVRYALRDVDHFALVSDVDSGPTWGGLTATQFSRFTSEEFAADCAAVWATFGAVITVESDPVCLEAHRTDATTMMDAGDGITVWVKH